MNKKKITTTFTIDKLLKDRDFKAPKEKWHIKGKKKKIWLMADFSSETVSPEDIGMTQSHW